MICVSLGRTRHKMMIAEHKALAERGAELVELRLDWLSHSPDLGRLLPNRPTPVIVTCRRENEKGHWKGNEDARLALLRAAIVAGVEYVDLEEDTAKLIRRYGKTKRIISYHNFDETPADIEEIYGRLCKLDADVVKLVTMANTPADNVRILKIVAGAKIPTTAFCMGELGVVSRILTGRYGAPFTYATYSKERTLAPGQLSYDEMKQIYHYDQINSSTAIYGVAGDPIAHSLSPLLHNATFQHEGLDAVYLPLRIPKDMLPAALEQYEWLGISGYSVTLPHKEAAVAIAAQPSEAVKAIGAANTLYRSPQGEWKAANTDYDAALETLQEGLSEGHEGDEHACSISGKRTLMLGAGGVARAIGQGVLRNGGVLMITNRTSRRADELAQELKCQRVNWENRGAQFADIVINCTSVGMHPRVDETPFTATWLNEESLVFDTIYNPEQTLFIKQARERGCRTVTGVEMFVRQAARQFELFTGRTAPLDFMRKTVRRAISAVKPVDDDE